MADKIGTDEYGEILIYQTDDGQTNIEVKIEDDTVWLTQQQLTELYQCSKSNISEYILSGIIKCPVCGSGMYGNVNRKKHPV